VRRLLARLPVRHVCFHGELWRVTGRGADANKTTQMAQLCRHQHPPGRQLSGDELLYTATEHYGRIWPQAAPIRPPHMGPAYWGAPAAHTRAREAVGAAESDPFRSSLPSKITSRRLTHLVGAQQNRCRDSEAEPARVRARRTLVIARAQRLAASRFSQRIHRFEAPYRSRHESRSDSGSRPRCEHLQLLR
jgi:hypothetical protein